MTATKQQILDKLKNVIDPELGIDVVSMGFVYDIKLTDETAVIRYSLTSPHCPLAQLIENEMKQELLPLFSDADQLQFELVFDPAWTPDRMSEQAKQKLAQR